MVQEDERKMDAMSKRHTELTMVNNNSKLLNEMLDHYDKTSCGAPELDLLKELFESCEKMQPKLFRMAAESTDDTETGTEVEEDEDGGGIVDILNSSDELTRVIDRYKMIIIQGKPDITKHLVKQPSEALLDLELASDSITKERKNSSALLDEDLLGLNIDMKSNEKHSKTNSSTNLNKDPIAITCGVVEEPNVSTAAIPQRPGPSIDDLLLDGSPITSAPVLATSNIASHIPRHPSPFSVNGEQDSLAQPEKSSRQRGLEELDFLGEVAIKSHLPTKGERSPKFAPKKNEKLSMNELKQRKIVKELKTSSDVSSDQTSSSQMHFLDHPQHGVSSKETSQVSPTLISPQNASAESFGAQGMIPSESNGPSYFAANNKLLGSSNCDKVIETPRKNDIGEGKKEHAIDTNGSKNNTDSPNISKGTKFQN